MPVSESETTVRRDRPRRTLGDNNIQKWGFDLHPEVFFVSAGLILLFVAVTLIFQEPAENAFSAIQNAIAEGAGWFMILATSLYLGVVVILAFSKYGKSGLFFIPC